MALTRGFRESREWHCPVGFADRVNDIAPRLADHVNDIAPPAHVAHLTRDSLRSPGRPSSTERHSIPRASRGARATRRKPRAKERHPVDKVDMKIKPSARRTAYAGKSGGTEIDR